MHAFADTVGLSGSAYAENDEAAQISVMMHKLSSSVSKRNIRFMQVPPMFIFMQISLTVSQL